MVPLLEMGTRKSKTYITKSTAVTPLILFKSKDTKNNIENGLYLQRIYMPEEVIIHILSFVEPEELLNYCFVCHKWNQLIKSYTTWSIMYERKYKCQAKKLPWYLYYSLLATQYFDVNLLLNGNGQDGLKHWEYKWDGEEYVEDIPIGVELLPENVPEFNNKMSCFATSYFSGYKKQTIIFSKNKLFRYILGNYKPHIYLSEWTAGRLDCSCEYILQCEFLHANQKHDRDSDKPVVKCVKTQWKEPKWKKLEIVVTDYPDGIEGIIFENTGNNLKSWKGHYGIKMAGGVVKFLFDSIEPLKLDNTGNGQPKQFSTINFFTNQTIQEIDMLEEEELFNEEYDDEIYYYMPC